MENQSKNGVVFGNHGSEHEIVNSLVFRGFWCLVVIMCLYMRLTVYLMSTSHWAYHFVPEVPVLTSFMVF